MNPLKRIRRPRLELFSDSLSGRVLWLTVGIILAIELMMLLPDLGRVRQEWLMTHIRHAHLAAITLLQAGDTAPSPAVSEKLLRLADVKALTLRMPGYPPLTLASVPPPPIDLTINLDNETLTYSTWRALLRVAGIGGQYMQVSAAAPLFTDGASVSIIVSETALDAALRHDAWRSFTVTVIVALVTGLLVFALLDRMLVRPMYIITTSITRFREDPAQADESELSWLAARPEDEVSSAARELQAMQEEMRAALWRNARLAAVGTSVAKISHDLRNILSTALLVADRLQAVNDPVVQRATKTFIPAVERAAQLVSRTVDFAREGPPPITRSAVELSELAGEAISVVLPDNQGVQIENLIPASLVLPLDRAQIYRVLVNLMRNAAEAGATMISLTTETQAGVTRLRVRDNGPGLPLRVQDNLFKPFTSGGRHGGTGLGLAIARDLIRAHGGDLIVEQTGPRGTVFCMELATSDTQLGQIRL